MKTPNPQRAEKRSLRTDGVYDVHSIFSTIQGEGPFTGQACVFIRLAGCNINCPGCDTEYTEGRADIPVEVIVREVLQMMPGKSNLVVITGGEPFRQDLYRLCLLLAQKNLQIQIECNGTLGPVSNRLFYMHHTTVVCSPKAQSINEDLVPLIDAYKYVMASDSVSVIDGLPVKALGRKFPGQLARPHEGFKGTVYLQPMDAHEESQNAKNIHAVVASAMNHGYTVQLQTHKYLGVE